MPVRPLIGLTCYTRSGPDWTSMAPGLYQDFVFRNYPRSVFQAGGQPVLLPVSPDPEAVLDVLDRLDGLVLTGGPDVAPHLYGQMPKPGLDNIDLERDRMEWALALAAWDQGLPTLGICRGVQLMNVVHGGDLYQDISREAPEAGLHTVLAPKSVLTHPVIVAAGTRLASIMGEGRVMVNSGHHQAVRAPAPELVVAARAEDGIIEALERPGGSFHLGVQWHPEGTAESDEPSRNLFRALTRAADEYRRNRPA